MSSIKFIYRCRRCHAIESNPHTAEDRGLMLLLDAINERPSNGPMAPRLLSIHRCRTGVGISDLIGYEPE